MVCGPSQVLVEGVGAAHLAAFAKVDIGVLTLVVVLVERGEQADHALEQQQDVVEGVDFELLEEGTPHVPLMRELLEEWALLVQALKVLDHADLLSTIHLLVILEQLLHNTLKDGLLGRVLRCRDE